MTNALVIARFNEDLAWITQVPDKFSIFVYNKGEPLTAKPVLDRANVIVHRPNQGREAETYIHHLMTVSPDAGGHTVFTQGDTFAHSPEFIEVLQASDQWSPIQPLSFCWQNRMNLPPIPPESLLDRWRAEMPGFLLIRPELFSLMTWGPLHFHDVGPIRVGNVYREFYKLGSGVNIASHFLSLCHLERQAERAAGHLVGCFSYGAIFGIDNALIGQVPPASIERMHELSLAAGANHGHIFERLWLHIFSADFLLPVCHAGLLKAGG